MLNECYIGDCREGLKAFVAAGLKAQVCVTSPPYWGLRDYGDPGQIGLERTPQRYVARLRSVFRLVREALADDGVLWLNLGDCYANDSKWGGSTGGKHARGLHGKTGIGRGKVKTGLKDKDLVGIPWSVAFMLRADGWYLRQDIIWSKPACMPESVRDRCTKSHEYLFLLTKSKRYYYDADAIKEPADPAAGRDTITARRQVPPGHSADTGFVNGRRFETRNKRSVWTVSNAPYPDAHFATFPPKLIEPCILAGSRPGDIVLDPFMGSGTTAQVAEYLGRQWIGCEINPEYVALQANRLRQQHLELATAD